VISGSLKKWGEIKICLESNENEKNNSLEPKGYSKGTLERKFIAVSICIKKSESL
jgi:hypothetical protein